MKLPYPKDHSLMGRVSKRQFIRGDGLQSFPFSMELFPMNNSRSMQKVEQPPVPVSTTIPSRGVFPTNMAG